MKSTKNRDFFLTFVLISILFICWVFVSRNIYGKQHDLSGRYYSASLIFIIPLASIFLLFIKEIIKKKILLEISLFFIALFQIYLGFLSFRDLYILDAKSIAQVYSSGIDLIAIPPQEKLRLSTDSFRFIEYLSSSKDDVDTNRFLEVYRYWGHDILVLLKKSKKERPSTLTYPQGTAHQVISKLITSKKGGTLSIVRYSPIPYTSKDIVSFSPDNLFKNSNLEIQQDLSTIRSKFKQWVDDGAVFYETPHLLPQYIELPTQYHIKKIPFYPIAFSETDSPIEGKYSLHVKFNYKTHSYYDYHVKLLHAIKSLPGDLSFYAKAIKPNSHLIVSKIENDSHGRWIATEPRYHILLNDTQTHFLSFSFDSFVSVNSLYLLQGVSADVVLDCIQYIPH